ncbi:MAG: helix-turn-helix transcriptional regulator [Eubacterium sp.]
MKIDTKKLDLIMAENCLSAEELAKLTGVSSVTVSRIKKGTQKARPKTIGKIVKALNLKVNELIKD